MGKPRSPVNPSKPRDRTGDLCRAFDRLRDTLPTYQSGRKKLTKIETLKLAAMYIDDLASILIDVEKDSSNLDGPDVRLGPRKRRTSTSSSASSTGPSRTESVSSVASPQQMVTEESSEGASRSREQPSSAGDRSLTAHPLLWDAFSAADSTQVVPSMDQVAVSTKAFQWPSVDVCPKKASVPVASQLVAPGAPDWAQAFERKTPSGLTDFQMPSSFLFSHVY